MTYQHTGGPSPRTLGRRVAMGTGRAHARRPPRRTSGNTPGAELEGRALEGRSALAPPLPPWRRPVSLVECGVAGETGGGQWGAGRPTPSGDRRPPLGDRCPPSGDRCPPSGVGGPSARPLSGE